MKVMIDGQFVDRVVLTEDEYFDLIDERDKYRAALQALVANSYEQSNGMADYVVTTCEALEQAKDALND